MEFAPTESSSFDLGGAAKPDFVLTDSGCNDIGPGALAADRFTAPPAGQLHDLEVMLLESWHGIRFFRCTGS